MTKVSVAFITDRHYVIPTVVAVTSLLCNKKPDTYYDIYIIAADLSNEEIEKFYELGGSSAGIHIIKSSLERFKGMHESTSGYITFAVYLKFDLPDLIPDQDKVLYLDSDIIIQKDLSGFFEKDIKDYYAGVIKDIALIDNELNIKNYFNDGCRRRRKPHPHFAINIFVPPHERVDHVRQSLHCTAAALQN